uniref:Aromatic-L-amino-acid decarboxylase n=1 Tax=Naja naja TaxID=35670 RepID=A0A8C6VPC8_NAJNA
MDATEFRKRGKEMVDYIADYIEKIEERQVYPDVEPGYLRALIPEFAPETPERFEDILKDVERIIMPGASSPACTELETVMLDWLGKMINLPPQFLAGKDGEGGGVIQGTASEATLVAMLAARTKAIRHIQLDNENLTQGEIIGRLVAYTSDQVSTLFPALLGTSTSSGDLSWKFKEVFKHTNICHILKNDIPEIISGHPIIVDLFSFFKAVTIYIQYLCRVKKRLDLTCAFKIDPVYLKHDHDESGKLNELNEVLLKNINDARKIHLVPCHLRGKFVLRFAICARTVESSHIQFAWKNITTIASVLLKTQKQSTD